MSLQMCLLSEGEVAQGAVERPQVFVHSHVRVEVAALFEPLAAHLAVPEFPVACLVASSTCGAVVSTFWFWSNRIGLLSFVASHVIWAYFGRLWARNLLL